MPNWILHCPFCTAELIRSEIAKDLSLSEVCFPRKPDLPLEGLTLQCPHCQKTSVLQKQQLTYRKT